jgi:hypothetical protein
MELDDLKTTWKQRDIKRQETQNIMELIHQKSRGPLASLKHAFRKQMVLVTVLMIAVSIPNAGKLETVPGFVLYFTWVAFCMAIILAFYINYSKTDKMENMDRPVKNNLEEYIVQLELRLKWQYIGKRLVVLLFILLLEILPLFYHARMLDKWHSVPPVIRFSSYALYLALLYFMSHRRQRRKFGRHLDHLKDLLNAMK